MVFILCMTLAPPVVIGLLGPVYDSGSAWSASPRALAWAVVPALLDREPDAVDGRLEGKGGKAQSRLDDSLGDGGR